MGNGLEAPRYSIATADRQPFSARAVLTADLGSVQEPALQTFRLPRKCVSTGGVDADSITAVTISFGGDEGGSVDLDNVGVITPPPPR